MHTEPYRTLDDLRAIISNDIRESVTLEYKRSAIISTKDNFRKALCKSVSAFANSAGGYFITGIEAKVGKPIRLDDGSPEISQLDWIYKIINSAIYPPVETVTVHEIVTPTGVYYVIGIDQSPKAPHQFDHRYYKRRGTHSEPMEHYEIEDVRNRPKQPLTPLHIGIDIDQVIAVMTIKNTHPIDPIGNLLCDVNTNFAFEKSRLISLVERRIRRLPAQTEHRFLLDSVPTILENNPEAESHIEVEYEFHLNRMHDGMTFFFADFKNTVLPHTPAERAIDRIGEKLDKIATQLGRLQQNDRVTHHDS